MDPIGVADSADAAVCLSTLEGADSDAEDFVLHCDEDAVLLAGARGELNLKESRWKEEKKGRKMLIAGIQKELDNAIQTKKALRPLSVEIPSSAPASWRQNSSVKIGPHSQVRRHWRRDCQS